MEAVLPPVILGVIIGFFWAMLYLTAGDIASGKEVEVHGRRSFYKQIFAWLAGILGVNGSLILGAGLLLWILWWATMRLVRRPQRTVWQVEGAV